MRDALLTATERAQDIGSLVPIQKGRELSSAGDLYRSCPGGSSIWNRIARHPVFKRINYNESVRPKIYDRMIAANGGRVAERFLSEGNGEAARIRGNRVRDLNEIQSEAYRKVEEKSAAWQMLKPLKSTPRLTTRALKRWRFYEFTRTMQAYKSIIADNTTIVLSTDSELFKFLKGITPKGDVVPAQRSGDTR